MDSPLNPYKPQYGNMMINDHDIHRLPQISDEIRLFPKVHFDPSEFELSGGSHTTINAVTPPSSLFLQNSEISNDFTCTDFSLMQMREANFRAALMQPVEIDVESLRPPERKNVKISKEPQSVAARRRREKISHRMRVLQKMVPGGMKLDTASMLDEAANYVKFLKKEIELLEQVPENYRPADDG